MICEMYFFDDQEEKIKCVKFGDMELEAGSNVLVHHDHTRWLRSRQFFMSFFVM